MSLTGAYSLESTKVKTPVLQIKQLAVAYGGIEAVKGIDLHVNAGEMVTLIGSNGAGKTSTMKAIMGMLPLRAGEVYYQGQAISEQGTWERVRQGMAMVPEGRGVFARMTIVENLQMGAHLRQDLEGIQSDIEHMFTVFPRLAERKSQLAGTLSGGEQQMLAMARALMARPNLLLLDEPSMGLSPIFVEKIFEVVCSIRAQGMTVFLVEQNARLALQIADRAYVMESGCISLSGPAHDLLHNPQVRTAYLGE